MSQNAATYEDDFYAWTQTQAERLRARAHNEIDWENVAEEIDSLGSSDRRQLRNRFAVLTAHLLKWRLQHELRGTSWTVTISNQRDGILDLVQQSPSLRQFLEEAFNV